MAEVALFGLTSIKPSGGLKYTPYWFTELCSYPGSQQWFQRFRYVLWGKATHQRISSRGERGERRRQHVDEDRLLLLLPKWGIITLFFFLNDQCRTVGRALRNHLLEYFHDEAWVPEATAIFTKWEPKAKTLTITSNTELPKACDAGHLAGCTTDGHGGCALTSYVCYLQSGEFFPTHSSDLFYDKLQG